MNESLERTISELLMVARTPRTIPTAIRHADVLEAVDATWRGRLALVGRPLTVESPYDLPDVVGNPVLLRHALDVLLDNALTHGGGEVRIAHQVASHAVTITVADEGPGFANLRSNRTTPATESAAGEAPHGLGLPLAERLIAALPGRLVLRTTTRHPEIDLILRRSDVTSEPDGLR